MPQIEVSTFSHVWSWSILIYLILYYLITTQTLSKINQIQHLRQNIIQFEEKGKENLIKDFLSIYFLYKKQLESKN